MSIPHLLLVAVSLTANGAPTPVPPAWAYPVNPPGSAAQLGAPFVAPDRHPEEHPPAPPVVTHGRAPDVEPCGHCHRMTGSGGPENAPLAGLPAAYILRQLEDYRHGVRTTAVPARLPPAYMIRIAKALTSQEMTAAAQYFSKLTPQRTIRVIETAAVPRTHVADWHLAFDPGPAREAIGHRIVEVPDTDATFSAYVPPGSLARGKVLADTGSHATAIACIVCHGPQLQGLGMAPPLAGRSPSYLFRQLYEIQSGIRAGANAAPMKIAIAALTTDDLIAVAAWAAAL